VDRFSRQLGKIGMKVSDEARQSLLGHSWPGNIRELQNVIERAVILSQQTIGISELPEVMARRITPQAPDSGKLEDMEREAIMEALTHCNGNRRLTAERLGISRRTLQYRLRQYGIVTDG
jgi:DNA-binding NtrC family response regulator